MAIRMAQIKVDSNPIIQNRKSKIENSKGWSRREFLGAAALAGVGSFLGLPSNTRSGEPQLEITSLKLLEIPALCWAPQYVAEELLRAEGFSRVQYVKKDIGPGMFKPLSSGEWPSAWESPVL